MIVHANAKINWALNLTGVRPNGYHELDMLMQSVSLCDTLYVEPSDGLSLACSTPGVPCDERNLVLRAALALRRETGCTAGADIRLVKRIPSQAGLGGGSSDCAAALLALNRLWGLCLPLRQLEAIGLTLGADVPFCLRGGLLRAQGLGEILTPLPQPTTPVPLLLVKPHEGLSTPQVYRRADELGSCPMADIDAAVRALADSDACALARHARNMLAPAAISLCPRVGEVLDALRDCGAAFAAMSGSGTACLAWFEHPDDARTAAGQLTDCDVFFCETTSQGIVFD